MRDAHLADDLRPEGDETVHAPVAEPHDPESGGHAGEPEDEHHDVRRAEREHGQRGGEVGDERGPDEVRRHRRVEVGRRVRVQPVEHLLRLWVDLVVEVGGQRVVGETDREHRHERRDGKYAE
jgi:hypothetical protein